VSVPALSVVIPAYNETARLPATLAKIDAYLRAAHPDHEILVVDDGSTDGTADAARAAGLRSLSVIGYAPNRGKGYAVRRGMLAARGARRLMTDADLSTPIEDLAALSTALAAGADIAVGSRAVPTSNVVVRQPWYREGMGRVFNVFVRLLVLPDLKDTQCGFKLFTAAAAESAFEPALLEGFSFDVETLYIARRRGLRIAEIGVTWRNDEATHVGWRRGGEAFLDLVRIRANAARGRYRL
jgi:dolichyl-phosphate beta-glucosyltransferase